MTFKPFKYYEFWIFLIYGILGVIIEENRVENYFASSLWFSCYLYEKLKNELKGKND